MGRLIGNMLGSIVAYSIVAIITLGSLAVLAWVAVFLIRAGQALLGELS